MSGSEKIWVIDVGEEADSALPSAAQSDTENPSQEKTTIPQTPGSSPKSTNNKKHRSRKYYGALLGITYLLGPLSLLLTQRGRRNKFWVAASLVSGLAGIVMLWRWQDILSRIEGGSPILLWSAVTSLVIILGFTTWARAIYLTGGKDDRPAHRWPWWVKKPWIIGGLGFLAPGFGLLVAGCRKRAIAVLWFCWPVVLSGLILTHGAWIWDWHRNSRLHAASANTVEYILLIAAAVTFVGVLSWIAQALEGARQVSSHYGARVRPKSDRYISALIVTIAVSFAVSDSSSIAKRFERLGGSLRQEGFQVIPLYMMLAANHLDPSRPIYAIQAIELYDELDKREAATRLRKELDDNMQPYLLMIRKEEM